MVSKHLVLTSLIFVSALVCVPELACAQWYSPSSWFGNSTPQRKPAPRPPVTRPQPPQCLGSTSPQVMDIESQLRSPVPGSYLAMWRAPNYQQNFVNICRADVNSQNMRAARQVASLRQLHVSRDCIRAAIASRANDNVIDHTIDTPQRAGEVRATMCRPQRHDVARIPCLTETYVGFIHDTLNAALRCVSEPDNVIDPNWLFGMVNNESAFMGFIHYNGGVGLTQLTGIAGRDLFNEGAKNAGRQYLDQVMTRPEKAGFCRPFQRLIVPVGPRSLDTCTFVGVDDGFARNAIAGVALAAYYLKESRRILESKGIRPSSPAYQSAVESFAELAYNAGMTTANGTIDKIGARALAQSREPARLIRNAAIRYFRNDYIAQIEAKRGEIAGLPRTCSETP